MIVRVARLRAVIDPEMGADMVRMRLVEKPEADDEGLVWNRRRSK